METIVKEGIVLKSIDYKESSRILTILTEKGKESLIIKGVRKLNSKFKAFSTPLSLISFISSNAKLPALIDGDLIKNYSFIKEDLTANLYANHIIELANIVSDSDIDLKIFYPFLLKCLRLIEANVDSEIISFVYELKLLYLLSVQPSFKTCVSCGKEEAFGFSITDGGVLCRECGLKKFELLDTIKSLYFVDLDKDVIPSFSNSVKSDIRKFIDSYYQVHVGIKTKSHIFF